MTSYPQYASSQYQYNSPQYPQYGKEDSSVEETSNVSDIPMGLPLDGSTPDYIRAGFVRKVYSILSVQLVATFVIGWYVNGLAETQPMLIGPLRLLSLVLLVSTMCTMCCCGQLMRKFPYNYALLAVMTFALSISVGFATAQYKSSSVILAVASTALIFACLTVYACFTKTDWTGMGPYLAAGLFALIGFGFMIQMFCWFGMCPGTAIEKLYAFGGVLIFTMYIVYDTQMIMGGNTKNQYTVDDYAFAALNLYLDIINLFLYLLQLFGERE